MRARSFWSFKALPLRITVGVKDALAFQQEEAPTPVRLDSLLLFAPGSAEFRADSAKVLIDALVTIKARPGWLIVISAHTDS